MPITETTPGSSEGATPGNWGGEAVVDAQSDLTLVVRLDVLITLVQDRFVVGANGPLRFEARRRDGQTLALPNAAAVKIFDPLGAPFNPTPNRDRDVPATVQPITMLFLFTVPGIYKVRCLMTFGDVIEGMEAVIYCDDFALSGFLP